MPNLKVEAFAKTPFGAHISKRKKSRAPSVAISVGAVVVLVIVGVLCIRKGPSEHKPAVAAPIHLADDVAVKPRHDVTMSLPLVATAMLPAGWSDVLFGGQPPRDFLASCKRRRMDDAETPRFCSACRETNDPLFRCADLEVADNGGIVAFTVRVPTDESRDRALTHLVTLWGQPSKTVQTGEPCWSQVGIHAFLIDDSMLIVTPDSPYRCPGRPSDRATDRGAARTVCRSYFSAWERMCSRCNGSENICTEMRSRDCSNVVAANADASELQACTHGLDSMTCVEYMNGWLPAQCWPFERFDTDPRATGDSAPPEIAVAASSTHAASAGYTFDATNLVDGNWATSWQPSDSTKPAWVQFRFARDQVVTGVSIANGFQTTDRLGDEFLLNSRIAKGRLRFSDNTEIEIEFSANERGLVTFDVRNKKTRFVSIIVDKMFQGRRWNDLAISEVRFEMLR